MKTVVLCLLLSCTLVLSSDLFLGNPAFDIPLYLVYHTQARYRGIPFIKREKDIFYNHPRHKLIAKIEIVDSIPKSRAKATVTAGGIGQSFVNIRLTSERGRGFFYDISIYTNAEVVSVSGATEVTDAYGNDYRNSSYNNH